MMNIVASGGTARSYTTRNGSAVDVMLEIPNDPP